MDEAKTRDQRIEELLAQSAQEAVGSIKGPSLADLTQPEEAQVEAPTEAEDDSSSDRKIRIRSSRLKTLEKEIETYRSQAELVPTLQERLTALESQIQTKDDDLPDWWKQAYGDTEISRQGYKNQQRIMQEEFNRNLEMREAQRQAEERERAERIEAIEETFDSQMDELEETIGRELTDNQKAEIMDIVGEYSPMEGDRYVAYMPISKAYNIWNQGQGQSPAKQEMARIAGSQSSGNAATASSSERPQWGDWRKRFGN